MSTITVKVQIWWVELVESRLIAVSLSGPNGNSPRFSNLRPSNPLESEQLQFTAEIAKGRRFYLFGVADPKPHWRSLRARR